MIVVKDLHKIYGHGTSATHALKGVGFEVNPGEFVAIMGRSGSGKSTLLHILGLLDPPTSGEFLLDDKNVLKFTEGQRGRFRLESLGYVFQEYSLIPEMTILENVYVPALCLDNGNGFQKRAAELLEIVGLGERLKHYPNQVSGGEQQRAAIARSLINRPKILFADEPTASLDMASARVVLELFKKVNKELGQTIVMVTHGTGRREARRPGHPPQGRSDRRRCFGLTQSAPSSQAGFFFIICSISPSVMP